MSCEEDANCPICFSQGVTRKVREHPSALKAVQTLYDIFQLTSPSKISSTSLYNTGVYQVIPRPPLSIQFDLSNWTPDYISNPFGEFCKRTATEGSHYPGMICFRPKWIRELEVTAKSKAGSIYSSNARNLGYFTLSPNSEPEVISHVDKPGYPGLAMEAKRIEPEQIQELVEYGMMTIADSYLQGETDFEFFYDTPMIGFGMLAFGFIGMFMCLEMVGCACFVSVVTKPFFLKTKDHQSAVDYISNVAESHGEAVFKQRNETSSNYYPFVDHIFRRSKADSLISDPLCEGVSWTNKKIGSCFYKLISLHRFVTVSSAPSSSKPVDPKTRAVKFQDGQVYAASVEERELPHDWSFACVFSIHIFRVYSLYSRLIPPKSLVRARLLHRQCTALIECQFVGDRNATDTDLTAENMKIIAEAMIWLAQNSFLYIDFRPQNVRVSNSGDVWLVDYDDMVILEKPLCCGYCLFRRLQSNPCGQQRLQAFPLLSEVLQDKICENCKDTTTEVGDYCVAAVSSLNLPTLLRDYEKLTVSSPASIVGEIDYDGEKHNVFDTGGEGNFSTQLCSN
jgi:hypothetical protein